jgi:Rps23 Pro-64 3,4-dihydroxylase Tpa1-like proline 4-hydroxylase
VAELKMPPAIREAMWQFNSSLFLFFLHHLTGIRGLTGDPWLYGGGIHQILPGGLLKIHADFNIHEFTGLLRRINVLVYLNKDWQDEWGGHLELWDTEMSRCVRRVAPNAGTCVIFNTSSTSYHGHPDPLRCPPGRTRKSLAFYYYTIDPEFDPRGKLHSTLWRKRPGEDY